MKLSEKAMLVSLNISQWGARKLDRRATDDVIKRNRAKNGSGRFNKLLVDLGSIKRLQRAANDARTFHYKQTLPWMDDGQRILPAENYMKYMQEMRKLQSAFEGAVSDFVDEYPALIERASVDLGRLFNSMDYPKASQIRGQFKFSTHVDVLPDKKDFRVNLGDDEVEAIQADIEKRINEQVNASMNDLWRRLYSAISHLKDKLSDKKAIFRDSLVGNISELTDVLPRLNITKDTQLSKMIQEAKEALAGLDPDDLRKDEKERKATAEKAEDILKKMAGYIGA